MGLEEGHEDDERDEAHLPPGKAEKSGVVQLGAEKAWDDLIAAFKYLKEADKKESL